MKNRLLLIPILLLSIFLLTTAGCKKKKEETPCDGKGNLCILNKLDSTVVISMNPSPSTFPLTRDNMHCSELTGDQTYNINVSGNGINRDTAITVLTCDKKLLIIQ